MVKAFLISAWFLMHPVHVTLTSIDFVPEHGGYNVFVRMYLDDFLTDSRLNGRVLKDADFKVENAGSKEVMETYLSKKLIITVNGKIISGKVLGMEISDAQISTNLEYNGGKKPNTIIVKNLIMTDLYADMSNMVIVTVKDFEEGVKLTSDITEQTFKIK